MNEILRTLLSPPKQNAAKPVMSENSINHKKLPAIAYATLPATKEIIAIRLGESDCLRVSTGLSAEELNILYGVSTQQACAMLAGLLSGWHSPAADPDNYDANGIFIYQQKCA